MDKKGNRARDNNTSRVDAAGFRVPSSNLTPPQRHRGPISTSTSASTFRIELDNNVAEWLCSRSTSSPTKRIQPIWIPSSTYLFQLPRTSPRQCISLPISKPATLSLSHALLCLSNPQQQIQDVQLSSCQTILSTSLWLHPAHAGCAGSQQGPVRPLFRQRVWVVGAI